MPSDLLSQKKLIEGYLAKSPSNLSSHSFVNIFAWKDFFEFEFTMVHDNLCIFAKDRLGCFMYLPPLGDHVTSQTIEACFKKMESHNGPRGVTRIENVMGIDEDLFPTKRFKYFHKGHEYCYFRQDLVGLKGTELKSQRWLLNHFMKQNDFRIEAYHDGFKKECLDLYEKWARERKGKNTDEVYRHMIEENRQVHQLVLENHKKLDLIGRIVTINGAIAAYTFGYRLTAQMFCVLLEVTDLSKKGLAAFIFHALCADEEVKKFKFINCMDDFGMENVAKTKMSFKPAMLVPSYAVKRK